jgi:hypothetical protein
VFADGSDSSASDAAALPTGWVPLDRWTGPGGAGTFWSQYTNQPTGRARTLVRVSAETPAAGRWNLAAVELAGGDD